MALNLKWRIWDHLLSSVHPIHVTSENNTDTIVNDIFNFFIPGRINRDNHNTRNHFKYIIEACGNN